MTTGEHKMIKDFVLADDHNWATAYEIQRALPEIGAEVRRQFLETIAKRLKDELGGYRIGGLSYDSGKKYGYCVLADREQWCKYQNPPEPEWPRTSLCLQAWEWGNDWHIGISSPVPRSHMSSKEDLTRRELIEKRLKEKIQDDYLDNDYWPWYEPVEQYRNWDLLIPNLHRELQKNGGEITDYFVNKFKEIAKFAKPILDDVEGSSG